ncbi:acyltransferase domain-containing protein [Streptomyces sp. M10(2022)]
MASVELSAEGAARELEPYADLISVAAINGPVSTILSGDRDAMRELLATLQQRGVFCRLVRVDFASHGPQVEPLRQPLLDRLQHLAPRAGSVPMYSTVVQEPLDGSGLDADYWARNLREPVYFGPVIEKLLADGPTLLVEISPHPILTRGCASTSTGRTATASRWVPPAATSPSPRPSSTRWPRST